MSPEHVTHARTPDADSPPALRGVTKSDSPTPSRRSRAAVNRRPGCCNVDGQAKPAPVRCPEHGNMNARGVHRQDCD